MENKSEKTHFALLLTFLCLVLGGCHYKQMKTESVDGSSFGFGSGSPTEQKALAVLDNNCAGCHGSSNGAGGVGDITNPQSLLDSGLIVAGNPSQSPLMSAIESGRMPPGGSLAEVDVASLRDWISGSDTQDTPTSTDPLNMVERNSPDLYFGDGRVVTLMWSLGGADVLPAKARFASVFLMDVRVIYEDIDGVTIATGYRFTNPRLQMLTGEFEAEVEGVIVRINGVTAHGIEPFLSARKTSKGVDPVNLYAGSVDAATTVVSNGDRISVSFGYLSVRARTDDPPIPPNPTLRSNVAYTSTAQVPITITGDGTARRWCLTAAPATPVSTSVPCPGFERSTTTTGWLAARPTAFDLATVGRPIGLNETITFYLWVANSDLKISKAPGSAQVTLDTTAPPVPVFTSISVTDTQIADIVGLQNNADAVAWCVLESSSQNNVQNANACSFQTAKPAFVGLRQGGTRFVAVFVRDRAGNLARSNIAQVSNSLGRISFDQLTSATTGNRAVFLNQCASCHGAGMANQANWDSTSYSDTVAKKSQILNRVDSSAQPMPPAGLMDAKDRALIRLWFTQTSTPVQL